MEFFIFWLGMSIACAVVANNKGRSVAGWLVLGLLFSVAALIVVLVLPSLKIDPGIPTLETHQKCPHCAEYVLREAVVCKHCGRDLHEPRPSRLTQTDAALLDAVSRGDWSQTYILLADGADPNAERPDGVTAIDLARQLGNDEITRILVDRQPR